MLGVKFSINNTTHYNDQHTTFIVHDTFFYKSFEIMDVLIIIKFEKIYPVDEVGLFSHDRVAPLTSLRKSCKKLSHYIKCHNIKFPSLFPYGFE